MYALAGIREYWIINLKHRKLELHLNPDTEEGIYGNVRHFGAGERFASPFCGETAVVDLLPEPEEEE